MKINKTLLIIGLRRIAGGIIDYTFIPVVGVIMVLQGYTIGYVYLICALLLAVLPNKKVTDLLQKRYEQALGDMPQ